MKLTILALMLLSFKALSSEDYRLIQLTHHQDPERKILCLTDEQLSHPDIAGKANFLKRIGAMDAKNCTNMSEDEIGFKKKIYQAAIKQNPILDLALAPRPNGRYELIITPTAPTDRSAQTIGELAQHQRQDRHDYLKLSAVVIGSIVVGNLASDRYYNNAQDKVYHARYGGAMSAAATVTATAAAFIIADTDISPTIKKLLIGCSGFMISTLAGVTKEILDMRDRTKNTVDGHDALATSLGGGMGVGCAYYTTF